MSNTKQLISITEILRSSWNEYKKDWKKLLEISIRLIFAGLVELAFALIANQLAPNWSSIILSIGTGIAYVIILQTIIVLIDYLLQKEHASGSVTPRWKLGINLFWPYLWVLILVLLATLGGLFLFVLPGLWLSILFSFALFTLIDEKKKGTQALARSAELIKTRWWKTLWRLLVPSIIIVLITLFATLALTGFVSIFSGGFEQTIKFLAAQEITPLQRGINAVINSLVSIVVIPLALLYQIKLYISLKNTQK